MKTLLRLHIQPRASKSEVTGLYADRIKIRIAAPPVDGAANEELIRFLSAKLGAPKSAVTIRRGESSAKKDVEISGIPQANAEKALLVK